MAVAHLATAADLAVTTFAVTDLLPLCKHNIQYHVHFS